MCRNNSIAFQIVIWILWVVSYGTGSCQTSGNTSGKHYSVNFISIGAGVDYKAEVRFSEFLKAFQRENKITLEYKIRPWGKEGESEYLFDLKRLSDQQSKNFKATLSKMFKENKLVHLREGSP